MNGPMRRAALALFAAFLVIALDITYWQVVAADRLREDARNTRVLALAERERGQIVSADSVVLARSVLDPPGPRHYTRVYPYASLYAHTVGFTSRLGDGGVEASHAPLLTSGSDLTVSSIIAALLGEDLRAHSLQLTLDHRLQQAAARALGDRRGAVAALDPATGRVLALVNAPAFDPNSLVGADAEGVWEELAADPARPLDNRALGRPLLEQPAWEELAGGAAPDRGGAPDTALGLALRAAAIAEEGRLMAPYLVARVFDPDSRLESETAPAVHSELFSAEEAASLAQSLVQVIIRNEALGAVRGLGEFGESGTPSGGRFAWFAGFIPADEPALAVAAAVEEAAGGPEAAAAAALPIGRALLSAWLDQQASASPP